VAEVQWSEEMVVGDPYPLTVVFRPEAGTDALEGESLWPTLNVAARLTAPSFDVESDSPVEQVLEDSAGSLNWSWNVTPQVVGSQVVSLDLLFTWGPVLDASVGAIVEPGIWYCTKTIEVGEARLGAQLEMARTVLVAIGLICVLGSYLLRWLGRGA
jgi:hypothetical protein